MILRKYRSTRYTAILFIVLFCFALCLWEYYGPFIPGTGIRSRIGILLISRLPRLLLFSCTGFGWVLAELIIRTLHEWIFLSSTETTYSSAQLEF